MAEEKKSRKRPARERILNAAEKLFEEIGYEKTTTKLISEIADVNEITIFRNFENKAGILRTLALTKIKLIEPFEKVLLTDSRDNIKKDLLDISWIYYRTFRSNVRLIVSLLNDNNEDFKNNFIRIPGTAISILEAYFDRLHQKHIIKIRPGMNSNFMALALLSNLLGYVVMSHGFGRNLLDINEKELIALNVEKFIHGCIEENHESEE